MCVRACMRACVCVCVHVCVNGLGLSVDMCHILLLSGVLGKVHRLQIGTRLFLSSAVVK